VDPKAKPWDDGVREPHRLQYLQQSPNLPPKGETT
jgi:hypothetical protein